MNTVNSQQHLIFRNITTIISADKERAVVVMDPTDHEMKINDLFNDKETYKKINDKRRNPTSKVEKDLTKLLKDIRRQLTEHDPYKNQIHDKLYFHLHITNATPARFAQDSQA